MLRKQITPKKQKHLHEEKRKTTFQTGPIKN